MALPQRRRAVCGLAALPLAAALAAGACAPVSKLPEVDTAAVEREAEKQRELIIEDFLANLSRLNAVAYRIASANADLCGDDTAWLPGLRLGNRYGFGDEFETAARRVGLPETAAIVAVAPGSPAERAGLAPGDVIVSINGWPLPAGEDAIDGFSDRYAEATANGGTVKLVVRGGDGGAERAVALTPELMCDYSFHLAYNESPNAAADGERIFVNTGMLRFAETDEELATVYGHELAHNMMDHIDKQRGNALLGLVVDALFAGLGVNTQGAFSDLAARAYSKEFEAEADYVGLYLTARAGYALDDSPRFWRRMAITDPAATERGYGYSHPSTPERFVALEKTVEEITAKRTAGMPLAPEIGYQSDRPETRQAASPFGQ